jgi:MFS family permease
MVTGFGFSGMQLAYGIAAAAAAALFLVFARAKPPTPASPPGAEVRVLVFDGLKQILKNRNVYFLSLSLFLASAIVNGVFTLIDGLGKEKGLSVDQGVLLTALLLLGGIVGSVVIPGISDGIRRRKPVLIVGLFVGVAATVGLAFGRSFIFDAIVFFFMGCGVTGITPVAYQYGAEITHPAPEGTSNGIFALMVQASGLLIVLMDALKGVFNNSYIPSFLGLAALLAVSGIFLFTVKESPEMKRGPST